MKNKTVDRLGIQYIDIDVHGIRERSGKAKRSKITEAWNKNMFDEKKVRALSNYDDSNNKKQVGH